MIENALTADQYLCSYNDNAISKKFRAEQPALGPRMKPLSFRYVNNGG